MRVLAVDPGARRIGLALTDPLGMTAQPLSTLERVSDKKDAQAIAHLCAEREVERVVVGLPIEMSGREGGAAEAARKLGDAVARATSLPVEYQDERLTSVAAERSLIEADVRRDKRKQVRDQVAAVLILQAWLDAQSMRAPSEDDAFTEDDA